MVTKATLQNGITSKIQHGLESEPQGYLLYYKNGAGDFWVDQSETRLKDKFLYLTSNADLTIKIWVF